MNKLKQILTILVFSLLLTTIAAAPILVMRYKNNRMFNHMNVIALPKENEEEQITKQTYDVNERLHIIRRSSGVTVQQEDVVSDERKRGIIYSMEEQFNRLTELGVVPQMAFSDAYQATIYKIAYIVPENPNESITLWEINVDYEEYSINAYLDADISILYGFNIMYGASSLFYEMSGQPEMEFLKYLGLDLTPLYEEREHYFVNSYFSETLVSVFIATYDEEAQKINSFYFRDSGVRRYKNIVTTMIRI